MMYRTGNGNLSQNAQKIKTQRKVLILLCAVLLVVCILMTLFFIRSNVYRTQAQSQFSKRVVSAIENAVDELNRMSTLAASNTSAKLGRIRQQVYLVEQLNNLSIMLAGGESGRIVSAKVIETIYTDLDLFEDLVQSGKNSTLDIHTQLLDHLTLLRNALNNS